MTWIAYRWVWRLESPVYIGMPPAGSINRARPYIPARVVWGALTAEIARHELPVDKGPDYEEAGAWLSEQCRFTYLFPAEYVLGDWCAWLPEYCDGEGLVWLRKDSASGSRRLADRALRRRLLSTRLGTSIDPGTDAAEDGSLRETESIQTRWRDDRGRDAGPVALVGYLILHQRDGERAKGIGRIEPITTLFVGGDTRYGLGHIQREHLAEVKDVFALSVELDVNEPRIRSPRVLAHATASKNVRLRGDLELIGGWDRCTPLDLIREPVRWRPGSVATAEVGLAWAIDSNGYWTAV